MAIDENKGIRILPAPAGVEVTLNRLEKVAREHGLKIFARIDFAKDAAAAGLAMPAAQLLIIGNPVGGTPLMIAAPSAALDLPLKVLAWQDAEQHCWVGFNTAQYLQQRHGFPAALMANIDGLEKLVQSVVTASDRA